MGSLGPTGIEHSLCYELTQTTSLNPQNSQGGYIYYSHFADEKIEAHRGEVVCLSSHRWLT